MFSNLKQLMFMVFQENTTLKDAIGGDGSIVPRVDLERLVSNIEIGR